MKKLSLLVNNKEKMKHISLTTALLLMAVIGFAQPSMDSTVSDYVRLLSPEKLYLHTDREVYNIGDTIWFRGYLRNASENAEYKECNYLYVELLAPKYETQVSSGTSEEVVRIRDRVKVKRGSDGLFTGYLPVTEDYNTGLAFIRAYSYWMLNFSPEYMYTKNIEIINPMKDDFVKNLVDAKMTDQINYDEVGVRNPFRKTLFKKKEKSEEYIDLQFLPESGRYLAGQPSVLGIKAVNREGLGVKVRGVIKAEDRELAEFETNRLGMGEVEITVPKGTRNLTAEGESYVENYLVEAKVPLPTEKGVVINVKPDERGVSIKVSETGMSMLDSTYLIVYDKSGIVLKSLYSESKRGKRAEYAELSAGINTVAVADSEGNVYAERPFFVFPTRRVTVESAADMSEFRKRERNRVSFTMKDSEGNPVDGVFSVSVTDEEYAPVSGRGHTIESYFLLGSELKGFVETPQYYFTDSISLPERMRDIDRLMMTQGWKYYDMEKILQKKTIRPRFGKEYTQSLSGHVLGVIGKARKSTLCFLAPSINYSQIEDLDSTAYFALNGLDFPDSTHFLVGAQGRGRLFKKWYTPVLNPEYFAADYTYPNYLQYRGYSEEYGMKVTQDYYTLDGTLTYTLVPSRIVATKDVSPYPNDTFKPGEYRDEKQLLPYKDCDLVSYIYMTCPGVRYINGQLMCRRIREGYSTRIEDSYISINIYLNGFRSTQSDIEGLMVSDVDAMAYVKGLSAAKYEYFSSRTNSLMTRATVLIKTKWPVQAAPNVAGDKPLGWQRPAKFYVPKYETKASKSKFEPMRSTLHWEPALDVRDGRASFEFYTSDHQAPYTVILEGITDKGDFVHYKSGFFIFE